MIIDLALPLLILPFVSALIDQGALGQEDASSTTPSPYNTPIGSESSHNSPGSRYRYNELAETEYRRAGFYFPVPYVVGGTLTPRGGANGDNALTRTITPETLGQLVRQHIAHQRRRLIQQNRPSPAQLANRLEDGRPILEGVARLTELRQTPYQRLPHEQVLSYEEKRRRWKAEMKRRMGASKVPPRPIAPVGSDGDRYYVTYSPYSNLYQVSRRPPVGYGREEEVGVDSQRLSEGSDKPVDGSEKSVDGSGRSVRLPATPVSSTVRPIDPTPGVETVETSLYRPPTTRIVQEPVPETTSEPTTTTPPTTTTTTTTPEPTTTTTTSSTTPEPTTTTTTSSTTTTTTTTTSTPAPLLVIVQKAEAQPDPNLGYESEVRVASGPKPTLKLSPIKQILRFDDYIEEEEDEGGEGELEGDDGEILPTAPPVTATPIDRVTTTATSATATTPLVRPTAATFSPRSPANQPTQASATSMRQAQHHDSHGTGQGRGREIDLDPIEQRGRMVELDGDDDGGGTEGHDGDEGSVEEEEDLFFWKPDYDPRKVAATAAVTSTNRVQQRQRDNAFAVKDGHEDPFQITAHQVGASHGMIE